MLNIFEQALVRAGVNGTERNKIFGIDNKGNHKLFYLQLHVCMNCCTRVLLYSFPPSLGLQRETGPHRDQSIQFFESSGGEAGSTRCRSADIRWWDSVSQAAGGTTWPLCAAHVRHPRCWSLHRRAAHQTARVRQVTILRPRMGSTKQSAVSSPLESRDASSCLAVKHVT